MAWSYNPAGTTTLDRVRRLIGDTDTKEQQLQDEEIQDFLTLEGSHVFLAAAFCCEAIAAKYTRREGVSVVGTSVNLSNQQKKYLDLAKILRARKGRDVPTAGGLSLDQKRTAAQDADLPPRLFDVGMHDDPELATGSRRDPRLQGLG